MESRPTDTQQMASPTLRQHILISDTVSEFNEDCATVTDEAAWVLDGATGITDDTFTEAPSDGHWYVREFDRYLREHVADTSKSLTAHAETAIQELRGRFDTFAPLDSIDPAAEPSATGVIVRWIDGVLEYYVLCDSTLMVVDDDHLTRHTDRRIESLETAAKSKLRHLKSDGIDHATARQQVLPVLRENRRQKNTKDAYWVLSFDPEAAKQGLTGQYELPVTAYLFSDGFGRLVETYDVYPDWDAAITDIEHQGVESALETIREIERDDPNADEYLRLKAADDVTVVKLVFGE
ncbi:hypothetical protein ACLI4Q_06345 [Natrialbaceae archaeon A-CW1-1]